MQTVIGLAAAAISLINLSLQLPVATFLDGTIIILLHHNDRFVLTFTIAIRLQSSRPAMASSSPPARHRRTHHSKHRHHYQSHGSRAHCSDHRQPEDPLPTVVDHPHHNKESLVQVWLEDLQAPKLQPVDDDGYPAVRGIQKKRSQAQSARPSPGDRKLQGLQVPEGHHVTGSLSGTREGSQRQWHHRRLDEDSSIIAPIDDHHRVRDRVGNHSLRLPATEECYYERGKKRQQTVSEASSLASRALAHADHRFEKRARRKTRDDRYNTLKFDDSGKEKKSRKKSGKKSNKKRNRMPSARAVMRNYKSNSILNDRITVSMSLILIQNFGLTPKFRCNLR